MQKQTNVKSSKWITCAISVLALGASFSFNNVVDMLILSYDLSVSCLLVPVFAALFIKNGKVLPAANAIAFGAVGFAWFRLMPMEYFPKEIASLVCSLLGFGIGEVLEYAKQQPLVEKKLKEY